MDMAITDNKVSVIVRKGELGPVIETYEISPDFKEFKLIGSVTE